MTFEYHHPNYYKKLKPKKEKPKMDLYEEETNKQNDKEKRGLTKDGKSLITDKTIITRDKYKPYKEVKNE